MASNRFCHAPQQETLDASLPMRTHRNEVSMPFLCSPEDAHSDVTYFDSSVCFKTGSTQLVRKSLDQCKGWLLLILQFGSVALSHFRWSKSRNRLQHVENQDLSTLRSKLIDDGLHHIFGESRIVNSH